MGEYDYLDRLLRPWGVATRFLLIVGSAVWLCLAWLGWFLGDGEQFVIALLGLTTGWLAMMLRRHWTSGEPIVWVPRLVTAVLFVVWLVLFDG